MANTWTRFSLNELLMSDARITSPGIRQTIQSHELEILEKAANESSNCLTFFSNSLRCS